MGNGYTIDQVAYSRTLYDLTVYFYYLQRYQAHDLWINRWLNVFLAVASSSSIAGWVIWQQYAGVWAFIVAASQVVNVINTYLPYKMREKTVRELLPEFDALRLRCESSFADVRDSNMPKDKIHALLYNLKEAQSRLEARTYDCGLPIKKKFQKQAEDMAKIKLALYIGN